MKSEQSDLVFNVKQVGNVLIAKGLTKREYFAALAMQGIITKGYTNGYIAKEAVEIADALIEELNK